MRGQGRLPERAIFPIDDAEMRELMRQIVNRLYTFHLNSYDPALRAEIDRWMTVAWKWDEPELDPGLIRATDASGISMSACAAQRGYLDIHQASCCVLDQLSGAQGATSSVLA